jgi:predicted transcriptional regulator
VFLRILSLTHRLAGDSFRCMPRQSTPTVLTRRERQIMDILYRKKQATAAQVLESMPDAPGYSAVRTLLATLESKGFIKHGRDGAKYVYRPIVQRHKAGRSAIAHLIQTFFGGSRGRAAAALLDVAPSQFSEDELDELEQLIRKAREGGRK